MSAIGPKARVLLPLSVALAALLAATEQARRWQDVGLVRLRLAVNLSARQLRQPELVPVVPQVQGYCFGRPRWPRISPSCCAAVRRRARGLRYNRRPTGPVERSPCDRGAARAGERPQVNER